MNTQFEHEVLDAAAKSAASQVRKRERMLYGAIILGVIWSFTYTAISLIIMWGVATQSSVTCEQFAESRDEVRAVLLAGDIEGIEITSSVLDEILPKITCD